MLLELLLVWIVGIPALAIGAALVLARRRERLTRLEPALRRRTTAGFAGPATRAGIRLRNR